MSHLCTINENFKAHNEENFIMKDTSIRSSCLLYAHTDKGSGRVIS